MGICFKKKAVSQPPLFQSTPLKFNIAPKNTQSQKETHLPTIIFQGRAVKFLCYLNSCQVGILAPKEKLQGIDIEPDSLALVGWFRVREGGEFSRFRMKEMKEMKEVIHEKTNQLFVFTWLPPGKFNITSEKWWVEDDTASYWEGMQVLC